MLFQYIIVIFVFCIKVGYDIFKFILDMVCVLFGFVKDGLIFLMDEDLVNSNWFLIGVIFVIIFFIVFVQMLYYVGFFVWFIQKFVVFFFWSLRVFGVEVIVVFVIFFIGQGELVVLICFFMDYFIKVEIYQIMICGFVIIVGFVLVVYIGMGFNFQVFVLFCIMFIFVIFVVFKMCWFEMEEFIIMGKVEVFKNEEDEEIVNVFYVFINGLWFGFKIGVIIVVCFLIMIVFVVLINGFFKWWGSYWGMVIDFFFVDENNKILFIQFIFFYCFYFVVWLLGVFKQDFFLVVEFIGIKVVINEFKVFVDFVDFKQKFVDMFFCFKFIVIYVCCVSFFVLLFFLFVLDFGVCVGI